MSVNRDPCNRYRRYRCAQPTRARVAAVSSRSSLHHVGLAQLEYNNPFYALASPVTAGNAGNKLILNLLLLQCPSRRTQIEYASHCNLCVEKTLGRYGTPVAVMWKHCLTHTMDLPAHTLTHTRTQPRTHARARKHKSSHNSPAGHEHPLANRKVKYYNESEASHTP